MLKIHGGGFPMLGRKILLVLGLSPFIAPLIFACTSSWAIFNPIIMYSVVFWPTYLIGAIFIVISISAKK